MNIEKFRNYITIFLFVLALCAFPAASVLQSDREFSENENRALAKLPQMTVKTAADGSFSAAFEKYAQDRLAGRDTLMAVSTLLNRAAGKKDNGSVYFGKDGYLFAIETIDADRLERNAEAAEQMRARLSDQYDVSAVLMIVPTATEILAGKLPNGAPVPDETAAIQSAAQIWKGRFCDVTENLAAHSGEPIYYRTDHHWTTLGAYYAYRQYRSEILFGHPVSDYGTLKKPEEDGYGVTVVSSDFRGTNDSRALSFDAQTDTITVIQRMADGSARENAPGASAHEETPGALAQKVRMTALDAKLQVQASFDTLYDETYLEKKDQYSYFLSGNHPVTVIERTGNGRTLLVIKDSYANCFIPFLTEDFNRIVAVDPRYYRSAPDALMEAYGVTDVLILYNILNFASDTNLIYLTQDTDGV